MKLKKKKGMEILLILILGFCFFDNFAIVNFGGHGGFGLQFSWFVGLIFLIGICFFMYRNKVAVSTFKNMSTTGLFVCIVIFSILDYGYLFCNEYKIEKLHQNVDVKEMMSRMIPHVLYIIFLFIVSLALYCYLRAWNKDKLRYYLAKYFITIPFFFIAFWGFIQWLSTFDIIEYPTIFNNNVSTGFTYLRFKWAHRSSSVFPEPSEYAYYLGFLLPFLLAFIFTNKPVFCLKPSKLSKSIIFLLYVLQCAIVQSFSLYAVFVVLLFVAINKVIKIPRKRLLFNLICIFIVFIGCIGIMLIAGDRVNAILSGTDGSMLARLEAFFSGLDYMKINVITGTGYGTFRAMDLLSGTLAYFGVIGIIYFVYKLFRLYKKSKQEELAQIIMIGFLCMIIVAGISNSIYEIMPFWMIPVFIDLLVESRKKRTRLRK